MPSSERVTAALDRLSRIQARLDSLEVDALVVSSGVNVTYLSGFSGSAGLLLVGRQAAWLLVDGRYDTAARRGIADGRIVPVEVVRVDGPYATALGQAIESAGFARVGFEAAHTTVAELGGWQRAAPGVAFVPTEGVVEALRLIKDASEIAILRRGGALVSEVASRLHDLVRPGLTERAVAENIERALRDAGFERLAFDTIVASGPNSALPHARPTDRRLTPGDLVVLDFGGVLDGYSVDLTRMAAVGSVSAEARRLFAAVSAAHQAAVDSIRPAVETWQVDRAARDVLAARGLGEAFLHSTGHGLGLEVHEGPRVGRPGPEAPTPLEAGMVLTIEPGAYVESVGGARVEDDVLVTGSGAELLTTAPRELIAV
jgi:Xaa-Pro aminopeptidase